MEHHQNQQVLLVVGSGSKWGQIQDPRTKITSIKKTDSRSGNAKEEEKERLVVLLAVKDEIFHLDGDF